MGDRANIVLRERCDGATADVYLYTHWKGYCVEQMAAEGLSAALSAGRADDAQYAGRIVTDAFLARHADSPGMGAGVSALPGDGTEHLVIIDFTAQRVVLSDAEDFSFPAFVERYAEVKAL